MFFTSSSNSYKSLNFLLRINFNTIFGNGFEWCLPSFDFFWKGSKKNFKSHFSSLYNWFIQLFWLFHTVMSPPKFHYWFEEWIYNFWKKQKRPNITQKYPPKQKNQGNVPQDIFFFIVLTPTQLYSWFQEWAYNFQRSKNYPHKTKKDHPKPKKMGNIFHSYYPYLNVLLVPRMTLQFFF